MVNYASLNGRKLRNHDGKPGGTIVGNQLVKTVRGSIHMLKRPRGWAIDICILDEARKFGVTEVVIRDIENGRIYCAPLDYFCIYGEFVDRGHGLQKCLPLTYWTVSEQVLIL